MSSNFGCHLNDWSFEFFDDKIVCRPTQRSTSRHVNGMWLGLAFIALVIAAVIGFTWDWVSGGLPADAQTSKETRSPLHPTSSVPTPATDERAIKLRTESMLADLPRNVRDEVERKIEQDHERRQENRLSLAKQRHWFGSIKIALTVGLGVPITGILLFGAGSMVYQGLVELNRPSNDAYTISAHKSRTDGGPVQLRVQRPGSGRWAAGIDRTRRITPTDRLRCRTHHAAARGSGETRTPESWQWIVILDGGPGVNGSRWSFQLAKQTTQPTTDGSPPPNVDRFANWLSHQSNLPIGYSF